MSLLKHAPATSFELIVQGAPHGKDRPRVRVIAAKGKKPFAHIYTPKETEQAEQRVRDAWEAIGSPRVEGPFDIVVEAFHGRPDGHYLTDGVSLSAEGRRHPLPENRKPDLDNVLKLVLDALNGCAYRDDVAAVTAVARRRWSRDGERVRVWVSAVAT